MNTLHNVGKQVSSFELYDQLDPITGIALVVDNEDAYFAGDETGTVLDVYCPYGTQEMANTLLSQLRGQVYAGFRAQNAILSPAAELGDWVTVNGGTYMLAYRSVTFGPGHMAEIAAPGESTQEHEYGWTSPENKKFDYELNKTRSLISKSNKEIQLAIYGEDGKGGLNGKMATYTMSLSKISARVEDTEGNYSLISQDVNKIAQEVHGTDGKGGLSGQYTALQQTVKDLSFKVVGIDGKETSVKLSDGKIDLSGLVTFSALEGAPGTGTTRINGGWIDADTLNLTGKLVFGDFTTDAKNEISGTASKAASTYIDEWRVDSPILRGAKIYGGEFWDTYECGKLTLAAKPPTTDPDGAEIAFPWLSYEATNYKNETANIFSVAPTVKDFSSVDMMMLGSVILSVSENGKIFPSRNWVFSNAEVTAVFGE